MNLLWVGLIAFACLHYPTSVNRERVVAQRELLQAAESALNGGLTPVLNLRTYDLSDGQ